MQFHTVSQKTGETAKRCPLGQRKPVRLRAAVLSGFILTASGGETGASYEVHNN